MIEVLLKLVTAPLLVAIVTTVGKFNLPPLDAWREVPAVVYPIVALVGSVISISLPKNESLKVRRLRVGIGACVLIVTLAVYIYFIVRGAPVQGYEYMYDITAFVSFSGAYLSFGFVVAEVVKVCFLVEEAYRKKQQSRDQ